MDMTDPAVDVRFQGNSGSRILGPSGQESSFQEASKKPGASRAFSKVYIRAKLWWTLENEISISRRLDRR
jgi:hypothetical protein